MSENTDPKFSKEEEEKKKKAAPWLPGAATANRGKFGTMLSRGGPLGRILASKAGIIGLALGVTALASLAGVMIAKQEPADISSRKASQVASRAAKYYTPSGARAANRSSLSLIAGNQDYGDEVAKASAEPEAAVEEAVPEVPGMPELPSVAKGRKFSASGFGGSTGGGGSSAVMSNKSASAAGKEVPASTSLLSDAFNSAKLGSGVRSTGMSRTPNHAASGKTGSRQAVSTQQMQAATAPGGGELSGALEKKKAKSGEIFGEGVTPAGAGTKAASGGDTADSYNAELPEASDDSSTNSSSGGGGGGGGGASDSASASCDAAESEMDNAVAVLQKSIGDLADMTAKNNEESLDKLCNVDGEGVTDQNIVNINGALDRMNKANETLTSEGCQNADSDSGWSCGVVNYSQTKAAAYVTQVNKMCESYYVMRKLGESNSVVGTVVGSVVGGVVGGVVGSQLSHSQKFLQMQANYTAALKSDEYKKAVEDMTNLDQKMNGSDSDGTGTGTNDGISQMKANYYENDCEYSEQGVPEMTADEQTVEKEESLWDRIVDGVGDVLGNVKDWVVNAAGNVWDGIKSAASWVAEKGKDLVEWAGNAIDDAVDWASNAAEDVGEWVGNTVNDVVDWVGTAATDTAEWVGNAASDVGDFVTNVADDVGGAIESGWNSVGDALGLW